MLERKGRKIRKISIRISQACHACFILGNLSMGVVFNFNGVLTQLNNAHFFNSVPGEMLLTNPGDEKKRLLKTLPKLSSYRVWHPEC